jgi:outer membrane receptor protein involved in Fe transport
MNWFKPKARTRRQEKKSHPKNSAPLHHTQDADRQRFCCGSVPFMQCRFLCLALFFILPTPTGLAQEIVDPFEEPEEWDLFAAQDRLVTVASRYQQTTREAPALVTVIEAEEIRRFGYRTLADVLQSVSGIFLSQSPEGYQLAWVRGVIQSDNNKILLMIDGVPTYDGFYTHAWIDAYLPLDHVRQIEVIKGPGSAIYGTNAFSAVINVVTYDAAHLKGGFVRASAGSFGTRSAMAMTGEALGNSGSWTAYARVHDTLGDGIERTPKGERDVQGQKPISATNAGFKVNWKGLKLRYDHISYSASYLTQSESNLFEVLLESPDEFNLGFRNDFLFASYDWELADEVLLSPWLLFQDHDNPGLYGWLQEPEISEDEESGELESAWAGTLVETEKHTRRYGAGVNFEARPAFAHVLVAGAGFEATEVVEVEDRYFVDFDSTPLDPSPFFVPEGEWVGGVHVFAQHNWSPLYWMKLTSGARLDYNQTTETFFPSPRLGVLMVPSSSVAAKLLYGRAFRAPSVRELLVEVATEEDGSYKFTASNPDLLPETIDTIEGELTWTPGPGAELRSAAFVSILDQTINKSDDPNQYVNQGGALIAGAELEAKFNIGPLSARTSYAFTWGKDDETGFPIYGFPPHMMHLLTSLALLDGLYFNTEIDAYSAQPRTDWAPDSKARDGDGFFMTHLGLSTARKADGHVRFDFSIRNVFDSAAPSLVYVERANATKDGVRKYPNDIEREGRSFRVGVDVLF